MPSSSKDLFSTATQVFGAALLVRIMGCKIELVGLCGAGKTTFITALNQGMSLDDEIILEKPVIPDRATYLTTIIKILCSAWFSHPLRLVKFLSTGSNWWLLKKIAYRQAGLTVRSANDCILVDSGSLQPFLSFEIEEKLDDSIVPVEYLLCGCKLPDIVLFFHVSPQLAIDRYRMRGERGEGKKLRPNAVRYFDRAAAVQERLMLYCKKKKIQIMELDTTKQLTSEVVASKLSELKMNLSKQS